MVWATQYPSTKKGTWTQSPTPIQIKSYLQVMPAGKEKNHFSSMEWPWVRHVSQGQAPSQGVFDQHKMSYMFCFALGLVVVAAVDVLSHWVCCYLFLLIFIFGGFFFPRQKEKKRGGGKRGMHKVVCVGKIWEELTLAEGKESKCIVWKNLSWNTKENFSAICILL